MVCVEESKRHYKIFRTLYYLVHLPAHVLFNYTHENDKLEETALVVSNHVTDFDFIFVVLGLNGSHMYFVASEHMMRWGWLSKVIHWLVAPIARRKGTTAMDTAMTMMRKLRAGHSVCVFGEGESSWNGQSIPIYPATATLAKVSGKPLKTFRIEGGHLTCPRWGKGIRRGKVHGHVVNTYSPEQLKTMSTAEINEAINRDIYEDAWLRQKEKPVRYHRRKRAEAIEIALFLCPKCKRIGTVYGKGSRVLCECGFDIQMTEYGTFEPALPFENIAQWDKWQHECLKNGDFSSESRMSDEQMTLYRLSGEKGKELLAQGTLFLDGDSLGINDQQFKLAKISNLALIQKRVMVLTYEDVYYELRASEPRCLRKYLAVWNNFHSENTKGE